MGETKVCLLFGAPDEADLPIYHSKGEKDWPLGPPQTKSCFLSTGRVG